MADLIDLQPWMGNPCSWNIQKEITKKLHSLISMIFTSNKMCLSLEGPIGLVISAINIQDIHFTFDEFSKWKKYEIWNKKWLTYLLWARIWMSTFSSPLIALAIGYSRTCEWGSWEQVKFTNNKVIIYVPHIKLYYLLQLFEWFKHYNFITEVETFSYSKVGGSFLP